METLDEEEEQSMTTIDRLSKKTNISFPSEIIEEILSRLPVKSIVRFRSVSKPWLSRISDPSFTKLHFTRSTAGHRTALLITAYDYSTRKRCLLSAACDGGPFTHLMTLDDCCHICITKAQHLNGLIFFTCMNCSPDSHAFVVNPSTRKVFKLPDPTTNSHEEYVRIGYLFGFDESTNEHKILLIRSVKKSTTPEFLIFSLSNHSWRMIDVQLPTGVSLHGYMSSGVCVNSVVHVVFRHLSFDILAFDFITENFSFIRIPQGFVHSEIITYSRNGKVVFMTRNTPRIMKFNGCMGVVCHDRAMESNEVVIWLLQDYENRVWVRETVKFPESWNKLVCNFPFPVDVNMDEIIFCSIMDSENVMIIPVYNMKSRCSKLVQFTLDNQLRCSETVTFSLVKCYVESIMPF